MKDTVRKFLTERGYGDELSKVGELLAVLHAKSNASVVAGDDFGHSRALITEFCKLILVMSKKTKPVTGEESLDQALVVVMLVRLFADREELEAFAAGQKDA